MHWVASTLSLRKISDILVEEHSISISYVKVSQLLSEMGYSKQVNQKMEQVGVPSPDRNQQFEFIDRTAHEYLGKGISSFLSIQRKKKISETLKITELNIARKKILVEYLIMIFQYPS